MGCYPCAKDDGIHWLIPGCVNRLQKPEAERFQPAHWSKFTDLLGFKIFMQHLGFDDLPHFSSHLIMDSIPWEMWPGKLSKLRRKLVFQVRVEKV